MSEDRRRPAQYASRRDEVLESWIATDVHPWSDPLRTALDAAGLGRRGVKTAADLARLPVTELASLGDGLAHVLQPTESGIRTRGDIGLRARLVAADVLGRRSDFDRRHVDVPFKPVRWTAEPVSDGPPLLVAWSRPDLDRLASLGRRALSVSGVRRDDRILATPSGAGIGALQLASGAASAGLPVLDLDLDVDARAAVAARPTVVSGTAVSLRRLFRAGVADTVRLAVVHAWPGPGPASADRLAGELGVPVRTWWAQPGARAAWASCGAGFHTWPTDEVLEVLDEGRPAATGSLVYTPVGWHGSVWLRLSLGVRVTIDTAACPQCGRTTPRIVPERVTRPVDGDGARPRRRRSTAGR